MKQIIRILAVLLAALLAVAVLASCENAEKGEKGDTGRGILKTEIIDGWLFITYSDDPENPVKIGRVNGDDGAESEGTDGLEYYLLPDDTYAVSGGTTKYLTEVEIPAIHNGKAVTVILKSAFLSFPNLKKITIPNSVTSIGFGAFSGCSSLTNITIPSSVTTIGDHAFRNSALTSITIPDSATSIGVSAFSGCSGLMSITIGSSVANIGDSAFYGCEKLVEVYNKSELPISAGNYTYGRVGYYAKAVYVEPYTSKLSIDENGYIFYTDGDTVLLMGYTGNETSLILPAGISEVYACAFNGCSALTNIIIPNGVAKVGNNAFSGCSALTGVIIPDSVTSIGYRAFSGCSALTSVTIPNGVTNIDRDVFSDCSALTSVTIPNTVTAIGNGVFQNCYDLKSITYTGTNAQWNIITKGHFDWTGTVKCSDGDLTYIY